MDLYTAGGLTDEASKALHDELILRQSNIEKVENIENERKDKVHTGSKSLGLRWKIPIIYFVTCEILLLIVALCMTSGKDNSIILGYISMALLTIFTLPGHINFLLRLGGVHASILFCTILILAICWLPDLIDKWLDPSYRSKGRR